MTVEGLQVRMENQIHGLQGNRLSPLPLSWRRRPSFQRRGRRERGLCIHAPMQVQVLGEMMNPKRLWKTDRSYDFRSSRRGTFAAQCQMTFSSIAVELDARRVWKCSGLQPPCRSCFDRSSFGEIPKRLRIGSRFAERREGSCRCGLPGREMESRTPPAQMPRRCCL